MSNWIEVPLSITDKLGQFAIWAGTRIIVVSPLLIAKAIEHSAEAIAKLSRMFQHSYSKVLIVFDSLPYGGLAGTKLIEIEAKTINEPLEICTDILQVLDGKHGLLIGGSGDGKTTTAMFIAYTVGGTIKVYDADAAADEWIGLPVVGRCADFDAIDEAMRQDLDELQQRTILRGERGSTACDGMDTVTIAEEFPLLVGEVDSAAEWLIKHGKRGRRVRKFVLAIAQNDTVNNFGIEGDKGVIDSFRMIRLGKKAHAHARKLKNLALEDWLKADRSRILVDDIPVQLPPYPEIKRVIQHGSRSLMPSARQFQLGSGSVTPPLSDQFLKTAENTPETTENQGFQPPETNFPETVRGAEIELLSEILAAFRESRSDDWVAKNIIMRSQHIGYQKARTKSEQLRELCQ
jgi:hypothetical protein